MKLQAKILLALPVAVAVAVLAFAGTASATFITSTCSGGQWQVGLPDLPWADGMTAKFDFHLDRVGDELYATRGQTVTAPADATFVFATYSNTDEQSAAYRPQGCVAVAPTTTVATSSVPVVTLAPPAPPVVAVAEPPVPQPQGVPAASQTLPATGGGVDLLTLGAAVVLAAGLVMVLVARRRVA